MTATADGERPTLTSTYPITDGTWSRDPQDKVYLPQEDSRLLVDVMERTAVITGRRVLDLCTGSGFVAIAAAELGCASVTAFDICPHAVRSSRSNAAVAGVDVDVRRGSWIAALNCAPFDVVVSNPPYVPTPPDQYLETPGPSWAWNAGTDGRMILDPLCESASKLLRNNGTMLLVQSAFAGVQPSLDALRAGGLDAEVIATQWIPFGPVLSARAEWLEENGRLARGCREEELVVIRADKP